EALARGPFDLILSITVLDHILDDNEFGTELNKLAQALKPEGQFFFLEYSSQAPLSASDYQAFRTMTDWRAALSKSDLSISNVIPFFHPDNAWIKAWAAYRCSLPVRAATRLEKRVEKWRLFNLVRNTTAKATLLRFPYRDPSQSIINVIVGTCSNRSGIT